MDKAGKNISQEAPWWLYFIWLILYDIIGLQSSKRPMTQIMTSYGTWIFQNSLMTQNLSPLDAPQPI